MATPITRDQFEAFTNLGYALRAVFTEEITLDDPLFSLYNAQTSNRAVERNHRRGTLGSVPVYQGAIEYEGVEPHYRADYTHVQYAKGIAVDRELIDDDETGSIRGLAADLGLSFDMTIIEHAVSTFENAFDATNYPGPDAVALCSASHPYSPTDATLQVNLGTSALTHDSLKDTRVSMARFKNSKGKPARSNLDTVVVAPENVDNAEEIIKSVLRSDTAENTTNTVNNIRILSSVYLSDTDNWFGIDSRMAKRMLNWYWRIMPEFEGDPASVYDLKWRYRGYMRFSYGWDAWQWIFGHNVS